MAAVTAAIQRTETGAILHVAGRMVIATVDAVDPVFREVQGGRPVVVDLSRVEALDTAGAWRMLQLRARLEAEGSVVEFAGLRPSQQALMEAVAASLPPAPADAEPPRGLAEWVAGVGEKTADGVRSSVELLGFFGLVLTRLALTIIHPRRLRLTSLVHHMHEVGFNAIPIISLMAFLIGVVLAFQGAAQLRQFGAEVFVVNLIAISILRELGILLTAIIVAGRSGSAFTASIGSMKIREEIDAMRTLGLNPIDMLVLPRVLALLVMLPILGFVANIMGLLGGGLMSWIELGVSPGMFLTRLYDTTDIWHLGIGMIKAPVFAVIIGIIGCYQGLKVEGSADSVGRLTTASVVLSIFTVIVADAVFSIFFAELGV